MIKHHIILGSSYENGNRIALDFIDTDERFYSFMQELNRIDNRYYSIAMHTISTKTRNWQEVIKLDPFFENVNLLKNPQDFFKCLLNEKDLTAIDVANYIVSKYKCTHTRLEKLVYFCYADYLCKYREKLFKDKIFAFKFGPVVESIYENYKGSTGCSYVEPIPSKYGMPIRSRIMNTEKGILKMSSIDDTLQKYKIYNTNTIVSLTHKNNTPWAINNKGETPYKEISDKDILSHHCYEEN